MVPVRTARPGEQDDNRTVQTCPGSAGVELGFNCQLDDALSHIHLKLAVINRSIFPFPSQAPVPEFWDEQGGGNRAETSEEDPSCTSTRLAPIEAATPAETGQNNTSWAENMPDGRRTIPIDDQSLGRGL